MTALRRAPPRARRAAARPAIRARKVTGRWRYARIARATHWMQLDKPDEVNKLLLEWFAGTQE
ncbi:MAG: hypothetical protein QM661_12135 [Solimonas sp.]